MRKNTYAIVTFAAFTKVIKKLIRNCEKKIYGRELENLQKERRLVRKIIIEKSGLLKDLDAEIKLKKKKKISG